MLKLVLILISIFNIHCSTASKLQTKLNEKPSILQGLTTENMTQITILRNKDQNFNYTIEPKSLVTLATKSYKQSSWVVDHISINNLNSDTLYKLLIHNKPNKLIDTRFFKSLDTKRTNIKISIASCMDDRFTDVQKSMWRSFINKKSDLHFFIGDNVYGDKNVIQAGMATPPELWQRYVDTRLKLEIYKAKILTPTLATWDDHDYGNNGGGINYPHKKESKIIFDSFFAQKNISSPNYSKGPGVSFMYSIGGQNYYFLDNRTFRTNSKAKNEYHLGQKQEDWLFDLLKNHQKFSWLINGNQFFGGYQRFESFEKNHPNNFKKFISKIKKLKNKVGFISGDRHLFEVMEIKKPDLNYSTVEITTSAIHAKVYPSSWAKSPNPRQLFGAAEKYNFATLETKTTSNGIQIHLNGFGQKDELLYSLNKNIR